MESLVVFKNTMFSLIKRSERNAGSLATLSVFTRPAALQPSPFLVDLEFLKVLWLPRDSCA